VCADALQVRAAITDFLKTGTGQCEPGSYKCDLNSASNTRERIVCYLRRRPPQSLSKRRQVTKPATSNVEHPQPERTVGEETRRRPSEVL
jgi:hypothetical protein